jgi:hypothetical protein
MINTQKCGQPRPTWVKERWKRVGAVSKFALPWRHRWRCRSLCLLMRRVERKVLQMPSCNSIPKIFHCIIFTVIINRAPILKTPFTVTCYHSDNVLIHKHKIYEPNKKQSNRQLLVRLNQGVLGVRNTNTRFASVVDAVEALQERETIFSHHQYQVLNKLKRHALIKSNPVPLLLPKSAVTR